MVVLEDSQVMVPMMAMVRKARQNEEGNPVLGDVAATVLIYCLGRPVQCNRRLRVLTG